MQFRINSIESLERDTMLKTTKLIELLENDNDGTIRSMLLNFPDDLTHLDRSEFAQTDIFDTALPIMLELADLLETGERWEIDSERHELSELALSLSLCPMHLIDYAICFDDENDECALLRSFFPLHDT